MTQTAKAQEPSMEEILASIRRIIADDDSKPAAKAPEVAAAAKASPAPPAAPTPKPAAPPPSAPPPAAANSQDEVDAMLAELDGPPKAGPKPSLAQSPSPTPAPVSAPTPPAAAEVLDLTEAMAAPTPPPGPAPNFRTIDGASDVVFTTRPEPSVDRALISNETIAAVDSAFNSLAHTVIGQNARTLEDLVREMLRPMLKSWLDNNLPGLVERIVRAEIERVSRGRP